MNIFLFFSFFACLTPSFTVPVEEGLVSIDVQEAPSLTKAEELTFGRHGDGRIGDMSLSENRNAIRDGRLRWPNGIVYYTISNEYTSAVRNTILQAMREIENDVNSLGFQCILFQPRTTQMHYVFIHKGTGCHSDVGCQHQGQQEVSIGQGCEIKGIIKHELLHSLGFFHEQNRFDRDTYLTVIDSNIPSNQTVNFAILPSTLIDTLGVDYSFDSIMHYGPYTLAADKSKPVLKPKPGKFNVDVRMGQRLGLSSSDVKKIQLLYNCPVDTAHVPSYKKEMLNECDFENGYCSLRHETGGFFWTLHQGATSAGPQAGNTNGADQYFVATADGHHGKRARFITPPHDQGPFCLDFFFFQKSSTSFLDLIASGDRIHTQLIVSTRGKSFNQWYNYRFDLNLPVGISIQITFEAFIDTDDVAIDDFFMYKGKCL